MKRALFVVVAAGLTACTATGQDMSSPSSSKPSSKEMTLREWSNLEPSESVVLKEELPVFGMNMVLNKRTYMDRSYVYLAKCDRATIRRISKKLARRGKAAIRAAGPVDQMNQTASVLTSAKTLYQDAQNKCGFDFSREIRQLDASIAQAKRNAQRLLHQSIRPKSSNLDAAIAILNGATAIAGAINRRSSGSTGAHVDDCMRNPSPHAVCR